MKNKKSVELGDRELDIMQVLWRLGKATVTEVHQALINHGGNVAYTTVQTMLNRLEASKWLRGIILNAHINIVH